MMNPMRSTTIESDALLGTSAMTYAIVFDLDPTLLELNYPSASCANAYGDIRDVLVSLGFSWQQGAYFGTDQITAVTCVLAVQALSKEFPWFKASVRHIRMLRIEEMNDLMPAL